MKLKPLNKEELALLYRSVVVKDFPPDELKPLRAMQHLMDQSLYHPHLVMLDDVPVGYALVWLPPNGSGGLLEYLGVFKDRRNEGLGSRILTLLAQRYGQIFGEAEAPSSPDAEENRLRQHRIAFYERNGFRVLDYDCALFGVHYNCLYRGPETDDRKVEALHKSVYENYFTALNLERFIQLPLRPGEAIHSGPGWDEDDEEELEVFP